MTSFQILGGNGGDPFSFSCPGKSIISKINARSSRVYDGIQFTCSDGTKSDWYGGDGGLPWEESSEGGWKSLDARWGDQLDWMQLTDVNGNKEDPHGGSGGDRSASYACPLGQVFGSAKGRSARLLDQLVFGCKPALVTAPVEQPLPPPVTYQPPAQPYQPPQSYQPSQPDTWKPSSGASQPSVKSSPSIGLILFIIFFIILLVVIAITIAIVSSST